MNQSIFKKSKPESDISSNIALTKAIIYNSIPEDALDTEDPILAKTHTEWRWKFYDINSRKMIEISRKDPNSSRSYIDNTGKWVQCTIDKELDKYVNCTKYYYCTD